jgi:nitroreductase
MANEHVVSENGEHVLAALRERRSLGRVKRDEVPRERIEQVIEAATWAPSHHNTQPWRFVVMTGEGRRLLGEGYANVYTATTGEQDAEKREKEVKKAFRAPVVIAAICSPSDDPRAVIQEELAAAQVAVQNLLLAAHAVGLGAIWRSGAPMFHQAMREQFKLREDEQIVGFIYAGYPDMTPNAPSRRSVEEVTEWVQE